MIGADSRADSTRSPDRERSHARPRPDASRSRVSDSSSSKERVMWWGIGIIGLIIWIAIAFWPARVAGRKGHSFIGFFIFSLVFFPAALIVAYVVRDRRVVRR